MSENSDTKEIDIVENSVRTKRRINKYLIIILGVVTVFVVAASVVILSK